MILSFKKSFLVKLFQIYSPITITICLYFTARLHKTVELDPSQNYMMGFHPHGIMSMGAFVNFSTDGTGFSKIFPGITSYLCMLKGMFLCPYSREYLLSVGKTTLGVLQD